MSETATAASYVQKAEQVIETLAKSRNLATDTQLRKIFSLSNRILSRLEAQGISKTAKLEGEQMALLYSLQVQIVYQSARMPNVKFFVQRTGLLEQLKRVSTLGQFIDFHRYLEALTAYQKFYTTMR